MNTYNNVSVAGTIDENTGWGWGRVSAAWVGVSGKCRGILH